MSGEHTAAGVLRRIRAAVDSEDPSAALAGLDELYLGSELSVQVSNIFGGYELIINIF